MSVGGTPGTPEPDSKMSSGMPSLNASLPATRKSGRPKSLAQARGRDWGLPDAGAGAVPITRPVRVDLYPDRMEVVPERGLGGGKVIEMRPRTGQSVDQLVSTVWKQMDQWGIAGRGMYWRPVLSFHVQPGAEERFAELGALLEGSGLSIKRKE